MKTLLILASLLCQSVTFAGDQGFRYIDGKCQNENGMSGLNPGYIGQCAMLDGATLGKFNFSGTDFRGSSMRNTSIEASNIQGANFAHTNLEAANLTGVFGSGVIFSKSNLRGARLVQATLGEANFDGADLQEANLSMAKLLFGSFKKTNLRKVKAQGTNFEESHFENVDFRDIEFQGVNLRHCQMTTVNFSGANLTAVDFSKSRFRQGNFQKINAPSLQANGCFFENSNFSEAEISKGRFENTSINSCNFSKAQLISAYFDRAKISKVNFTAANLRSVKMKTAQVQDSQFTDAQFSKASQLPFSQKDATGLGMKYFPLYEFSGIKEDLDPRLLDGWVECHRSEYRESNLIIDEILDGCQGRNLMLACQEKTVATLHLAAYADREKFLVETLDNTVTPLNGSGFYFNKRRSMGFAPEGETVNLFSCDTETSQAEKRLCWHTNDGRLDSGYRCGEHLVNTSSQWERIIYVSE